MAEPTPLSEELVSRLQEHHDNDEQEEAPIRYPDGYVREQPRKEPQHPEAWRLP